LLSYLKMIFAINYFKRLCIIISFLIIGCNNDNEENDVETKLEIDSGISKFADQDPSNDVFMQGFWWDSYKDLKLRNYASYFEFIGDQIISLSNANIDLIWFPPPSEGEGMGYHPRKLFDFNSSHGSSNELKKLLEKIQSRKMHAMADLVFNHRVGTSTWTDFTDPYWSCESICINDEGFTDPNAFGVKPCGDIDEGLGWDGARDLNHQSQEVQKGLKEYLVQLKELGFDSWRYDFTKGFPAKYVGEYNYSNSYYYSVGEYWDIDLSKILNWINATSKSLEGQANTPSSSFDFPLKYNLKEAIVNKNYDKLNSASSIIENKNFKKFAVTFLDNHDTGCINRSDCDNLFSKNNSEIIKGYAYLLTHPGIPMIWIYHYLFNDPSGKLKKDINDLILIRKEKKIKSNSEVQIIEIKNGNSGYYIAEIDEKLMIKIGDGPYQANSNWRMIKSGEGFIIWEK